MAITDELREYVIDADGMGMTHGHAKSIYSIADRIDAEHRAALEKLAAQVDESERIGFDQGFASADDWLAQHEDAMAEHGWVKLPVSEDGDVLHIGELVDEKLPFGGYAAPAPIDTMELSRGASGYRWMVKLDAESRALISPKLLRHRHAPTVEDVLREFFSRYVTTKETKAEDDAILAEFAAKLRLAEEVDE